MVSSEAWHCCTSVDITVFTFGFSFKRLCHVPGFQSLPPKVVFGSSKPNGEMHENFTPYLQICYSLYLLKKQAFA
jgi:hypothetical protein